MGKACMAFLLGRAWVCWAAESHRERRSQEVAEYSRRRWVGRAGSEPVRCLVQKSG